MCPTGSTRARDQRLFRRRGGGRNSVGGPMAGQALEPGTALGRCPFMRHHLVLALAAALAAFACLEPASIAETLRCARFSREELSAPTPPPYPSALERMKWINQAVKSTPYSILFFGDSLTEGWD